MPENGLETAMRGRILLVARDPGLRARLASVFRASGYHVEIAESVTQARRVDFRSLTRAVVVPEGLGAEGHALASELQAVTTLRLVTTSPLAPGVDELSASDEISLLAWAAEAEQPQPVDTAVVLRFSDYSLDLTGHSLINGKGTEITLTRGEFRLLRTFVQRPGRVLSRDDLLAATAGRDAEAYDRSIDMLIMRVRRKIEPDPKHPSLIVTIPGAGYKFAAKVSRALVATPIETLELTGSAQSPASPAATPERRHLTVLQCMLSGPAFLAARQDPEDLHTLLAAFHERCRQVITATGGLIARPLSDGLVAYFGYPQADEHQAERAIRAGFNLIEAAQASRLDMRVGITSGLVVVGAPPGSYGEPTILGEAVARAAQLAFHADANTVLIADTTRRLIGGLFHCHPHAAFVLQDGAEPPAAWIVGGAAVSDSRFDAIHATHLSPFIGREAERALLMDRWTLAQAGEGQAVVLCGEPGIGKSRLLNEALGYWQAGTIETMRLQCSPHAVNSAYYPIIDNLQRALRFGRDETPKARLDKLEALIVDRYARPREDLRFIASILSIPYEERYGALTLTPQKLKDETLRALADAVEAAACRQPMVVLFEDVHWADPTTLEVIDRLLNRLNHIPLLLVMTHRPEFQSRWSNHGNLTAVTLPRLTKQQSVSLVSGVSRSKPLPPDLLEQILVKSDGVPLFLEEVTKAALEVVEVKSAADRSPGAGVPSALTVPLTLRDSLAARLDRQGPVAREIVQAGAAIGREFGYRLLTAIIDLPEPQLREALDRLTEAGLAFARGVPPEASYLFKHALVRDVAYGSLLRDQRRGLHRRIAAALHELFPEVVQAQPALLAQHCQEAGLAEQAVEYWVKAGQQALARSAMTEAVAQVRHGLDLLADLPDIPWRQQRELDLQITLGSALTATKGWAEAEVAASLARARALAEQLDRPEYLAPLIANQWAFHLVRSEHGPALALGTQLETVGNNQNDIAIQSLSWYMIGTTRYFCGEFATARAFLTRCAAVADRVHRTIDGMAFDPYAAALGYLAMILAYQGHIDSARSRMNDALARARRLRHTHTLTHVLNFATCLDLMLGLPSAHLEEFLTISAEHGMPLYSGYALQCRGANQILCGQAREGLTSLTQGLTEVARTGAKISGAGHLVTSAAGNTLLGQHAEAQGCLTEAARIIEATGERVYEADLYRVWGDLLAVTGDRDAAERKYRQAIAVAERRGAKLPQLRAATRLARLWRDQGKRTEACDLLGPIYHWFSEGFDTPNLQNAKALLAELA